MHWHLNIIALKAQSRTVQIFDLDNKKKLKSSTMNEDVVFWKWITESSLGLVTDAAIYHWDVFDENQPNPVKITDRHANLAVSTHVAPGRALINTRKLTPYFTVLPNHQLPRQQRRQVDGRGGY